MIPTRRARPGVRTRSDVSSTLEQPAPEGRKAATQARILEAAAALFSARGFERTSVSAIAARAGVSPSAIFWHFGDKATLFQEAFRTLLVPFVEELKGKLPQLDTPRERFFELFEVYGSFVSSHRESIEAIVRWVMESRVLRDSLRKPLFALHDEFVSDLRGALEGLVESPRRARALAECLAALLDGGLLLALLDADETKQELRREGLRAIAELILTRVR
jgi:AcrR family transcriptional regulator